MTTTIRSFTSTGTVGEYRWIETDVVYRKRVYGGWSVRRADNGRELGWLFKPTIYSSDGHTRRRVLWEARVAASAFRGDSIDDEGDVLDAVPIDLTNSDSHLAGYRPVGWGETRDDAATELLDWLHDHRAPALGYGQHWRVQHNR